MTRITILGAGGRMGQRLVACVLEDPDTSLAGALEQTAYSRLGEDAGIVAGVTGSGIRITSDLESVLPGTDVVIDFTLPDQTLTHLPLIVAAGKGLVLGTTGHENAQKKQIEAYSKKIPMVVAPNMSVGVNVLWTLIEKTARILGGDFDVEVVETHHRLKKDAPSGTAVRAGEVLAKALGRHYPEDVVFHREGNIGARTDREIGMQTLRGGDVVGDHTIYFFGQGERLELTHRATSRDTFAKGAIRAAKWLAQKQAGLYTMQDVLGLEKERDA